jgi:UDP-N-acetylmuramyl pentapeptide phosphotransferase/UDP-N-acetylglucosamine-1-phosphate transferase
MIYVIGFAVAGFMLSYIWTAGILKWTRRKQILDIPNNRSSHSVPTPRGGGIAIAGLTVVLWLLYLLIAHRLESSFLLFATGGFLVATMGWIDDVGTAWRSIRFLVHAVAAAIGMLAFGYFDEIVVPFLGPIHLWWFGVPLTFLWITGLTNAYNFMDGIDGMAGGQAVVAGTGWVILCSMINHPEIGILGLLAASTSLGFLRYNWPPAKIFMGDVGSSFLGYTFALIPLMCRGGNPALPFAALLLVWPFVFDTCFTIIRRARNGENILIAHRSHLYQRLHIAGWSHLQATLLYTFLEAIGVGLAWAWTSSPNLRDYVIGISLILCAGLWTFTMTMEKTRELCNIAGKMSSSASVRKF